MFLLRWISFGGRISLGAYWLTYVLPLFALYWIAFGIDLALFGAPTWIRVPTPVPTVQAAPAQYTLHLGGPVTAVWSWASGLPGLAGMTRRWHDRGRSGWWNLLVLVPVIGWIWLFISLGCRDGTRGPNRYGPDPLERPA
ncbi:DUF805 domain-containing protein [Roseomonas sp. BN140053]|uniref:DUF805 domain-containing protein n=1 Tax=Roseomonas sp. BN140053 TaxID=3391898 RepID=UPI0039EB99C1